ncbi:MAG: cupin domain-containing protein [candidate division WOR-3 bacterium]
MKINNIDHVKKDIVTDDGVKNVERQIPIGIKEGSTRIIMRLFTVKPGGHSPLHTHDFEHLVKVESGKGIVVSSEGEREIGVGDFVYVEPNEIHQFKNPFEEDFKFICVIPNK